MPPDVLRGFLQIGMFVLVGGLVSAWLQPRDSGEFVISLCSSAVGLALVLGVLLAHRLMK